MSSSLSAKPTPASPAPAAPLRVAAFVSDEISDFAIRTALSGIISEVQVRRGNIIAAIRFLEREAAPDGLIVDVSGIENPLPMLEALSQVCPPDVTVAVVGDNTDIAFYRLLVGEIGVAEYLPKPLTRDTVGRLLLPHLAPGRTLGPEARGGHIIAVCGASGGGGATTVAVSTALELADVVKGGVALVDLNLQHGSAALMLAARPGPGLRMALEDPEKADTLLLERAAIEVAPRMRLIAADESLNSGISITEAGARQVLSLIRQKFNFVVVDLPMPLRPELHQVLALARHVVVVMKPDVASVRIAREIRQLAISMAGDDRIVTMLNRSDMPGGLAAATVQKAFDGPVHMKIPELGKRMAESINLGVPAIRRVPELKKHMAPLIQEIAVLNRGKPSGSWLRRILGK